MIGEKEGAWLMCHWVGGEPVGRGDDPPNSHQRSPNTNEIVEFRIETKRTTSILGAHSAVYEELLFGPFRPVVRTSSFHVEDTGSIPVRDRYLFPAGGIIAE